MADFPIPSFITEQTADAIHSRMLSTIPEDIDTSEGQFAWDFTRTAALQLAYYSEYILVEAMKTFFPIYSSDEFLDVHAQGNGLTRKAATYATGTITVTGDEGTEIPLGSVFSTESSAGIESIEFETTEAATIPAGGTVDISVKCTNAGITGNVDASTIIFKSSSLPSTITTVTNLAATTGGTDEETDDDLKQRIEDVEQSKGVSHVGSPSDYKRWAESVDGVGNALILDSDNDGEVWIVLTDSTGAPASDTLCDEVYNYIMGTESDQSDRLSNVCSFLYVSAPTTVSISVSATVYLDGSKSLADVKTAFLTALNAYLLKASEEGEVKYAKVCSILIEIAGITDYTSVSVNSGTINIMIDRGELATATAADITLTEAT